MKTYQISNFSLKYSIECGQFFLYEKKGDFYYIINGQNIFKIKQIKNKLYYDGISKSDLIYFFSLDLDLEELTKDFNKDKYLQISKDKYFGLRIIRSNFWQCLIGFLCSSASNISKIQNNLKLICKNFGEKKVFDKKEFYMFPNLGKINDLEKLKNCKVGFRAKYIFEINNKYLENPKIFQKIKKLNYNNSKLELMKFSGIGSKIADCICLFSLESKEAFPIDTWVIQIINKLYLKSNSKNNLKEIEKFIKLNFRTNAGLKQQYLFHYARNNLK